MAKKFGETAGEAKRRELDFYNFKMGENRLRLVGGILPRYTYWRKPNIEGVGQIPIECLSFNRDKEVFDNADPDVYLEFFPNEKCTWGYLSLALAEDGKLYVVSHKKKLFGQIEKAAKTLGDPTDPDAGWEVVFTKEKTGPKAYNIEYSLDVLNCKERPLTDAEKELVDNSPSIDDLFPRPTADELRENIRRAFFSAKDEDGSTDDDAAAEFEEGADKPF